MIQVAVGIIQGESGTVLLCRRPAGKPYGLQWEFPGGKIERDESPEECLRRELREELGITAVVGRLFHEESHIYPDSGEYNVRYFLVDSFSGTLTNHAFDEMRWVSVGDLPGYDILEGNREAVLRLMNRER